MDFGPLTGLELPSISWSQALPSPNSWRNGCRLKMAKPCSGALYCVCDSGYFRCNWMAGSLQTSGCFGCTYPSLAGVDWHEVS